MTKILKNDHNFNFFLSLTLLQFTASTQKIPGIELEVISEQFCRNQLLLACAVIDQRNVDFADCSCQTFCVLIRIAEARDPACHVGECRV
jgi:hypothetical protein